MSNFSFSHSVFKRLVLQTHKYQGLFGKRLNCQFLSKCLQGYWSITTQCRILTHWRYIDVENIVRKGEIACIKQYLFFPQCFLPYMVLVFYFKHTLKCCLQFISTWTSLTFCCLVMGQVTFIDSSNYFFFQIKLFYRTALLITHSHTMTPFDASGKQAFWKHCGKRRNCS